MARGLSTRSGRAPDPNALRRERDGDDWTDLPAEGRKGRAPAWPLSKATARERALWTAEWKRPQAVVWERNHQQVEVALYVRSLVAAEAPDATTASRTLVRQQQEALGLSIPGLQRNRWTIGGKYVQAQPKRTKARPSKERFQVIDGGLH